MPRVATQDMTSSLSLRAAGSVVDCGTDCIGTGNVTVMGWMKALSLGSVTCSLMNNGSFAFSYYTNAPNACLKFSPDNGATVYQSAAASLTIGEWFHVALTRTSSGVINFFVKGIVTGSPNQATTGNISASTNLCLGNSAALNKSFNGLLKNWTIVPRVCTQAEIQAHMNGTTPTDAVRVYKMNEGTGSTMLDSSPNAVNATITSGTWTTDTPSKLRVAASGRRSAVDMNASLYIASNTTAPCRKVSATGISLSSSTISFGLFFNLSSYNSNSFPHLINIGAEDELCVFYDKGSGILNFKSLAISGGAISDYIVAKTVPYRVWNSLVINYDGVNFKGYLNGVLVYTKARTGSFTFTNSTVNAGSNTGTASMNGSLSNLFVSQNVLTPDQITDFATRGVIPSNSAVAWSFDEGAGQIAYDSSGNGNNGTITSGTWSADVPSRKRGVASGRGVSA